MGQFKALGVKKEFLVMCGYRRISLLLVALFLLSGCSAQKVVDNISGGIRRIDRTVNAMLVNTDANASLVIYGMRVVHTPSVRAKVTIYLVNEAQHKAYTITLNSLKGKGAVTAENMPPGPYRIAAWLYDACETEDSGGISCKEDMERIKGRSEPLQNAGFTLRPGDTLYLGEIVFDYAKNTISFEDRMQENIAEAKARYDLSKRCSPIVDIAPELDIHGWKFYPNERGNFIENTIPELLIFLLQNPK